MTAGYRGRLLLWRVRGAGAIALVCGGRSGARLRGRVVGGRVGRGEDGLATGRCRVERGRCGGRLVGQGGDGLAASRLTSRVMMLVVKGMGGRGGLAALFRLRR